MAFHITRLPKTADGVSSIPQLAEIQLRAWLTVPLYALIYYGPPSTHPTVTRISRERHEKSLLDDPTCQFLVAWVAAAPPETQQQQKWQPVAFIKYNVFPTAEAARNRLDASSRRWKDTSTSTSSSTTSVSPGGGRENDSTAAATATATGQAINVALASSFWEAIVATRQRHSETLGAHVSIDILATLPEYQGRGAGRQLLEQVLAEADALGLASVLEASQEGLRLYGSVGFVEEGEEEGGSIWVDMGRWAGGGDKGVDWRGGEEEDEKEKDGKKGGRNGKGKGEGWYRQVVMVREPKR